MGLIVSVLSSRTGVDKGPAPAPLFRVGVLQTPTYFYEYTAAIGSSRYCQSNAGVWMGVMM